MYKPWITNWILNSIKRQDKLFAKYIKTKNEAKREEIHNEYKILRNRINELINESAKRITMVNSLLNIQTTLRRYGKV